MVKNSTESFPYLLQSKFMLIHYIRLKNSRNPRISDFRNAFSSCFLFISQEGSSTTTLKVVKIEIRNYSSWSHDHKIVRIQILIHLQQFELDENDHFNEVWPILSFRHMPYMVYGISEQVSHPGMKIHGCLCSFIPGRNFMSLLTERNF